VGFQYEKKWRLDCGELLVIQLVVASTLLLLIALVLVLRGFTLKGQEKSDRRIRWIAKYFILIFAERVKGELVMMMLMMLQ